MMNLTTDWINLLNNMIRNLKEQSKDPTRELGSLYRPNQVMRDLKEQYKNPMRELESLYRPNEMMRGLKEQYKNPMWNRRSLRKHHTDRALPSWQSLRGCQRYRRGQIWQLLLFQVLRHFLYKALGSCLMSEPKPVVV